MSKGLLDDIPIYNVARDKAWEKFIKRKDVKHLVTHGLFDKGFPLYGGYYELWCQAWERAWTAGFKDGHNAGWESYEKLNDIPKEKQCQPPTNKSSRSTSKPRGTPRKVTPSAK